MVNLIIIICNKIVIYINQRSKYQSSNYLLKTNQTYDTYRVATPIKTILPILVSELLVHSSLANTAEE